MITDNDKTLLKCSKSYNIRNHRGFCVCCKHGDIYSSISDVAFQRKVDRHRELAGWHKR